MNWSPLIISLKTASLATLYTVIVGIPIGYILSREWRGKSLVAGLAILPLVLPPTVLGYFLLVLLGRRGAFGRSFELIFHHTLVFTWEGAALAASIASLPLMITQATVAFSSVGIELIEAGRVEGAPELQILHRITLPLARRGLLAGLTLAFARSLGDFGATLMVAGDIPGSTQTMPLAIYDAVQTGDNRTVLVFVVTASLLAIAATLTAGYFAEK
jgi:molybdate transport system permease protein